MEHIDQSCSLETPLQMRSICSVRIPARSGDKRQNMKFNSVGCLTLFDLVLNTQYRSLWSMHTSERGHANRIRNGVFRLYLVNLPEFQWNI